MLTLILSLWWLWLILLLPVPVIGIGYIIFSKKKPPVVKSRRLKHRLFTVALLSTAIVMIGGTVWFSFKMMSTLENTGSIIAGIAIGVVAFGMLFQSIKNAGKEESKPGKETLLKKLSAWKNNRLMWAVYVALSWWTLILISFLLSQKYPLIWKWVWDENMILVALTAPISYGIIIVRDIKDAPKGVRWFANSVGIYIILLWTYSAWSFWGEKIETQINQMREMSIESAAITTPFPDEPVFAKITATPGDGWSRKVIFPDHFPFRINYPKIDGDVRVRINGSIEHDDGPDYKTDYGNNVRTLEFRSRESGNVEITITRRSK